MNKHFIGTDRFQVLRRLGAGGMGVVYEAYDRERECVVALKTLQRADAGAVYRFKKEFRTLADVVHRNLVSLYELVVESDQWFFTMERVHGTNFLEYVSGTSTRPVVDESAATLNDLVSGSAIVGVQCVPATHSLDLNRLRAALKQLVEGVSALHSAGKLHRDIKPSNVMVTGEGRVVLLDFGLVTELSRPLEQRSLTFAGTPAYMAPEQATDLPVSEAADWYCIGVMLYEALTGRIPFTGGYLEVLSAKQRFEPTAPRNLVPDLPKDLNDLCQDLLRGATRGFAPQARKFSRD